MLELLQRIKFRSDKSWAIMGDFNETSWQFEHFFQKRKEEKDR
jgi:hypothetical protein